jgi:hypothetical protein
MCGIVADFPDSVKFGKEAGIEQVSILEQDQPVEMRVRWIVSQSQMARQFDDHCLGKPTQPDSREIRLTPASLLRLSPEIMEIRPKSLKEMKAVGVLFDHFAALRAALLTEMSNAPIIATTSPITIGPCYHASAWRNHRLHELQTAVDGSAIIDRRAVGRAFPPEHRLVPRDGVRQLAIRASGSAACGGSNPV